MYAIYHFNYLRAVDDAASKGVWRGRGRGEGWREMSGREAKGKGVEMVRRGEGRVGERGMGKGGLGVRWWGNLRVG